MGKIKIDVHTAQLVTSDILNEITRRAAQDKRGEEIRRYSACLNGTAFMGMEEFERGDYVKYKDHIVALEAHNKALNLDDSALPNCCNSTDRKSTRLNSSHT